MVERWVLHVKGGGGSGSGGKWWKTEGGGKQKGWAGAADACGRAQRL